MPKVLILIGSKSDFEFAQSCRDQLSAFGIDGAIEISSAHRHPDKTAALASRAEEDGYSVIIAMAGLAAALPGTAAAHSNLPVIGVPLPAALGGLDSLLAIAQMPPGIPVGAVAIGAPGAKNAAVLAARIIALGDPQVREALRKHRASL